MATNLNNHHRDTLEKILGHPASGNVEWRQVLSLLLRPRTVSGQSALKLIDEASAAIQSSRDQLQHALDHARQGVSVFDANLALTAWNVDRLSRPLTAFWKLASAPRNVPYADSCA